jgi:hypothetical protein
MNNTAERTWLTLGRINVDAVKVGVIITSDERGYRIERGDGTVLYSGIKTLIRVRTLIRNNIPTRP